MKTVELDTLAEVFCEIVEQMAFMFVEPIEAEEEAAPAPLKSVLAHLKFDGEFSGKLSLAVPVDMCAELAANMLGEEADDPDAISKGTDALKELLNVLCGNLLTAFAGEEPVFDLGVPEILPFSPEDWESLKNSPVTVPYNVDEYPVLLHINFGDE
jgi:CheY-specific phosphatase CheX